MSKIEIIKGEEFKNKITSMDKDDFFNPVYKQALKRLNEIANLSIKYERCINNNECENDKDCRKCKKNNETNDNYSNNIIAFCGERGEGKTSAMLTFSKVLSGNISDDIDDEIKTLIKNVKEQTTYHMLDVIDPTQLEEHDNILKLVVSRIFLEFKRLWAKTDHNKCNIELKNEMLKLFQKCYMHIMTIKNPHQPKCEDISFEDSLEELSSLGDSANLKNDMYKLISEFLKMKVESSGEKNKILVLQIDDTDLNIKKAYEIVEDLRKYLMVPNVVILMATKIQQLTNAVEQQFRIDFEKLISSNRIGQFQLQQMASKYIDKLIPDGRKIYLPQVASIADSSEEQVKLVYKESDKDKIGTDILNSDDKDGLDFQDRILKYIYTKTGLMFIKPNEGNHPIIPRTMRELVNFLAVISKLEDIFLNEDLNKEKMHFNLNEFEEYLLYTWVRNNVDDGYIKYIEDLIAIPNCFKHRRIITDIFDIIENYDIYSLKKANKEDTDNRKDSFRKLFLERVKFSEINPDDFSLGDVMDLIKKVEDYYPVESLFKFTFAIKTLYTLTMYKIYCRCSMKEVSEESTVYLPLYDFIGGELFGENNSSNLFPRYKRETPRAYFEVEKETYINYLKSKSDSITDNMSSSENYFYLDYKSVNKNPYKSNILFEEASRIRFRLSLRLIRLIEELCRSKNNSVLFFFNTEILLSIIDKQIEMYGSAKEKDALLSIYLDEFYTNMINFLGKEKNSEKPDQKKYIIRDKSRVEIYDHIAVEVYKQIKDIREYVKSNPLFFDALLESLDKSPTSLIEEFKVKYEYKEPKSQKGRTLKDEINKFMKNIADFAEGNNCQYQSSSKLLSYLKMIDNDAKITKIERQPVIKLLNGIIDSLTYNKVKQDDNGDN